MARTSTAWLCYFILVQAFAQNPTAMLPRDTVTMRRSSSDSIVVARARDSVRFTPRTRILTLYGNAQLTHRQQEITAAQITIDFSSKTISATWTRDSLGRQRGFPVLNDAGKHYAGETMRYNFATGKGTVTIGETSMENGFYFGSAIHKADSTTFYVQRGCFTTCDAPHPHFVFCSSRMKILPGDRVMLDDVVMMVEDVPVFYLPIGMVFPNRSGRQSGFLTPRPAFSAQRGVMLSNLGYYWAASDYLGILLASTYYSKGGFEINTTLDYALRYILSGKLSLSYANVRLSVLEPYSRQYRVILDHSQTLSPSTTLSAQLDFVSQGYINATQFALSERILSTIRSTAGLSHTFDNGIGLSVNYLRNQYILTGANENSATVSVTLPSSTPLQGILPSSNWLTSLTLSYSGRATGLIARDVGTLPQPFDSLRWQSAISHSPTITISPRFGYFSLTPSLSFQANTYWRRITRQWDSVRRTPIDRIEYGIFNEIAPSIALAARTTLYGSPLFLTKTFAIRHTIIPIVSMLFTPDLSPERYGYYSRYTVPADSLSPPQQVLYSRFALDGGGIAPKTRSVALNYTLDNSIDGKVFADTASQKIELFRFSVSGAYNFVADSLRLSDQNWSFRLPTIANLSLTSQMTTTLYDEAPVRNLQDSIIGYQRINRFRAERLGLASALRITQFSLTFSTSFNQEGILPQRPTPRIPTSDTSLEHVGRRFLERKEYNEPEPDVWGQHSPGYSPLRIPWNITLNASYRYSRLFQALPAQQQLDMSAQFNLSLTSTWSISGGASYDALNGALSGINITVSKQLHCWMFQAVLYPIGINRGFYIVINPIARVLSDLKIEKRSTPIFR